MSKNRDRAGIIVREFATPLTGDEARNLVDAIERALDEAVAAAVESCAKISEDYGKAGHQVRATAEGIACMIRALGGK